MKLTKFFERKHRLKLIRTELGADGFHLVLPAVLGKVPVKLILDTGASATVFDLTLIKDLYPNLPVKESNRLSTGLGTDDMEVFKVVIPQIRLGGLMINNYEASLLDLVHIKGAYREALLPEVHGVLGNDLLQKFHAEISYRKLTLKLKL